MGDTKRDIQNNPAELGESQSDEPMSDLNHQQKDLEKEMQDVERASLADEAARYAEKLETKKAPAAAHTSRKHATKASTTKVPKKPAAKASPKPDRQSVDLPRVTKGLDESFKRMTKMAGQIVKTDKAELAASAKLV